MEAQFSYDVTDFFGFVDRVSVWCNGIEEGARKVLSKLDYTPRKIKFAGCSVYDLGRTDEGKKLW